MKSHLRLKAKKNRAEINSKIGQNCISLSHINECLNIILHNKKNMKTVGLYYPMLDEISPLSFISYFNLKHFELTLPFVRVNSRSMLFKSWNIKENLIKGSLGNLEPHSNKANFLPELLIVPMLIFDKNLNRLGYGGGYYDMTINKLKNHFKSKKKDFITIGIAYSGQEIKSIPYEKHDERLDFLITEKQFYQK